MPLGFHWPELIIVVVLALLFFGPKRLPEMGSSVGKTIREFQKSMREVKEEIAQPETPPTVTPQVAAPQEAVTPTAATAAPVTPAVPVTPATPVTPVEGVKE